MRPNQYLENLWHLELHRGCLSLSVMSWSRLLRTKRVREGWTQKGSDRVRVRLRAKVRVGARAMARVRVRLQDMDTVTDVEV